MVSRTLPRLLSEGGSLGLRPHQAPLPFSSVSARKDAGSAPGMHATAPALSMAVATTSPSMESTMTLTDTAPMWLSRCDCEPLQEGVCPEIWKRVLEVGRANPSLPWNPYCQDLGSQQ